MSTPENNDEHIGDGAYVSFDGWGIWIAVNHHENKVAYLDGPHSVQRLVDYCRRQGMQIT